MKRRDRDPGGKKERRIGSERKEERGKEAQGETRRGGERRGGKDRKRNGEMERRRGREEKKCIKPRWLLTAAFKHLALPLVRF